VGYIRLSRPESPVVDQLRGFDAIAIQNEGTLNAAASNYIYGVNADQDALVVVNADDLSQRQFFKHGDTVVDTAGELVPLDCLSGVTDIALSEDGAYVYVAGNADAKIALLAQSPVLSQLLSAIVTCMPMAVMLSRPTR